MKRENLTAPLIRNLSLTWMAQANNNSIAERRTLTEHLHYSFWGYPYVTFYREIQGIPSSHGFDSHGFATHGFLRDLVNMAKAV